MDFQFQFLIVLCLLAAFPIAFVFAFRGAGKKSAPIAFSSAFMCLGISIIGISNNQLITNYDSGLLQSVVFCIGIVLIAFAIRATYKQIRTVVLNHVV